VVIPENPSKFTVNAAVFILITSCMGKLSSHISNVPTQTIQTLPNKTSSLNKWISLSFSSPNPVTSDHSLSATTTTTQVSGKK